MISGRLLEFFMILRKPAFGVRRWEFSSITRKDLYTNLSSDAF